MCLDFAQEIWITINRLQCLDSPFDTTLTSFFEFGFSSLALPGTSVLVPITGLTKLISEVCNRVSFEEMTTFARRTWYRFRFQSARSLCCCRPFVAAAASSGFPSSSNRFTKLRRPQQSSHAHFTFRPNLMLYILYLKRNHFFHIYPRSFTLWFVDKEQNRIDVEYMYWSKYLLNTLNCSTLMVFFFADCTIKGVESKIHICFVLPWFQT